MLFADYASRMKERLPALVEAKDQGLVGEGTDGFVYLREGSSEKVKDMISMKMRTVNYFLRPWRRRLEAVWMM